MTVLEFKEMISTICNGTFYSGITVRSLHPTETDAGAVVEVKNPTESDISVAVYAGSADAGTAIGAARETAYYGNSVSQTIRAGQTITLPFTVKAGYYAYAACNSESVEVAIQGVLDIHTPVNEYELATRSCDVTTWYTDGGETSGGTNYYATHNYVAEQFTEDTDVRITIKPTSTTITKIQVGCKTETSGNAIVHYRKLVDGNGKSGVVAVMYYTVRAGYYLTIVENSDGGNEIYIEKV